MAKLHLGCGTAILTGYENSDIRSMPGATFLDLEQLFPYKDNYSERTIMCHTLCLLKNKRQVLEEVYRTLKPGGRFDLIDNPMRFYLDKSPDEPHLHLISRKTLKEWMAEIGFKDIKERSEMDEVMEIARGKHSQNLIITAYK